MGKRLPPSQKVGPAFWNEVWKKGELGFHQTSINAWLKAFDSRFLPGSEILVPLSGKSLDLLWLWKRGFGILGVELSEIACRGFFEENDLPFRETLCGNFRCFEGMARGPKLQLWCGDYFAITPEHTENCRGWYDRAALIALPSELRQNYARHTAALVPKKPGFFGLLISLSFDESAMDGPPFSVPEKEVTALYSPYFHLEKLAETSRPRGDVQVQHFGYGLT